MLGEDSSLAITNSCQLGVGSCLLFDRCKFLSGMSQLLPDEGRLPPGADRSLPGKG